jgi:hypothetical protein
MTLNKLVLLPDQESYQIQMPTGILEAQLDGGAPRTRADIIGNWITVNVQWTGDAQVLGYLQQAYRYCEANGGAHFLIDLILDNGLLSEREAMFGHGSFKLVSTRGDQYVVGATLRVAPDLVADATWPDPSDYQSAILADEFGDYLGT